MPLPKLPPLTLQIARTLTVQVDAASWPQGKQVPVALSSLSGTQQVDMLAVMREISLRTAPPNSKGFDLASNWAVWRYIPALAKGSHLLLRPEWNDIDSHQKTILSDDWGVGVGMHIVGSALGFIRATSTNYFLSQVPQAYIVKEAKEGKTCQDS
jgi:hypothetical protein